jgi:Phage terminase large subunit
VDDNKLSLRHLLGEKYHPAQPEIVLAGEFEIAAVTGMGAGKTYAACCGAIRHAAKWPGARVLISRFTYDELIKSTKHLFFEIVKQKDLVDYFERPRAWDVREGTNYARMKNGAEFFFSNLDKNLDKHKNVEYSYVVIDQAEEIAFEVYQILLLRCRLNICPPEERHVLSLANDEGDNWIRQRFLTYEPPHGRPTLKATRRLIRATSLENPHLDDGVRAQYMTLPPELQRRWVYATMEAGTSRLIPDFRVVKPVKIPSHWPRWLGIDPARSTGVTCALWVTVNPDAEPLVTQDRDGRPAAIAPNAPHIYQEYWQEGRDAEDHAVALNKLTDPHVPRARVMDQTAWHVAVRSKKLGAVSVADLYVQAGLPVSPSSGDEWARVMLYLNAHRRGLTVTETCTNLLRQGPAYRIKGQWGAFGPLKISAKQKFHAVDAGGYALSMIPTRVAPVDVRELRPAFDIADGIDEGSRRHWEDVRRHLPMRRGNESVVTSGWDEITFFQDDDQAAGVGAREAEDEGY